MFLKKLVIPMLFLLAFALGACSPEDPFVQTHVGKVTPKNPAFLRVIHGAAGAPDVEVLVGDSLFFKKPQGYLEFPSQVNEAHYYPADTSAKTITFRDGSTVLATTQIALKKANYYTAYLYGQPGNYRVLFTSDTLTPTPAVSQVRLRVVNLSPDSPPFSIYLETPDTPPIVTHVAFGTASSYVTTRSYMPVPLGGTGLTGMWIKDDTGKVLIAIKPPRVPLPGNSVRTLIVAGKTRPQGDDPFIFLVTFQEDAQTVTGGDTLYGSLPFRLELGAVRLLNLIATADPEFEKDSALDLAFYDPSITGYEDNEFFRRSYSGQDETVFNVKPLAFLNAGFPETLKPYLVLNTFTDNGMPRSYPYRIEVNRKVSSAGLIGRNPVLVPASRTAPGLPLGVAAGKRYSIIAFGPFVRGEATSVVVADNSPLPTAGNVSVRLFHGAFGELQNRKLRLRVNGVSGPAIAYGQVPGIGDSFQSSPATTMELIDDATGDVIHTETTMPLVAGSAYTVYLSRGAYASDLKLVLTPVPEDLLL